MNGTGEILAAHSEAIAALESDMDEAKARFDGTVESGLKEQFATHADDAQRHVTAAERTAWNGKAEKTEGVGMPTAEFQQLSLWRSGLLKFDGDSFFAPYSGWLLVQMGEKVKWDYLYLTVSLPISDTQSVVVYQDKRWHNLDTFDMNQFDALSMTVPVPKGATVSIYFNETERSEHYGSTATVRFFKARGIA